MYCGWNYCVSCLNMCSMSSCWENPLSRSQSTIGAGKVVWQPSLKYWVHVCTVCLVVACCGALWFPFVSLPHQSSCSTPGSAGLHSLSSPLLSLSQLEIGRGNPGVFSLLPLPLPLKTLTLAQGQGFPGVRVRVPQGIEGIQHPWGHDARVYFKWFPDDDQTWSCTFLVNISAFSLLKTMRQQSSADFSKISLPE